MKNCCVCNYLLCVITVDIVTLLPPFGFPFNFCIRGAPTARLQAGDRHVVNGSKIIVRHNYVEELTAYKPNHKRVDEPITIHCIFNLS